MAAAEIFGFVDKTYIRKDSYYVEVIFELILEFLFWIPYYYLGTKFFGHNFVENPKATAFWKRALLGVCCGTVAFAIVFALIGVVHKAIAARA